MRIRLFCEDTFAVEFFKEFFNRLKNESLIPKEIGFSVYRQPADCNLKLKKLMRVALLDPQTVGFLIIKDADNDHHGTMTKALNHVPDIANLPMRILLFNWEIEEWILDSKKIKTKEKPSTYLKNHYKYKKKYLPKYALKIDLQSISNHQVFVGIISLACGLSQ